MMPLDFTDEEWRRPNGFTVETAAERLVWSSQRMQWDVFSLTSGRMIDVRSPDHERARLDPASAPIYALLRRKLAPRRRHLTLVR